MMLEPLLTRLFTALAAHKRLVWSITALVIAAGTLAMGGLRPTENIQALLPDDGSSLPQSFQLLQKAPFSQRAVIDVTAPEGASIQELLAVSKALGDALPRELFTDVLHGPSLEDPARFFSGLLDLYPNLFTAQDQSALEERLEPQAVDRALGDCLRTLISPEGIGLKNVLRRDPLDFRQLVFAKLRSLNLSKDMRLYDGRFISADGRSALLVARCVSAMTDATGSRVTLDAFDNARRTVLPPGFTASLLSVHRYTDVNATAIKADMSVLLLASTLAIAAIVLLGMRSWRSLFVIAVPLVIVVPAAVLTQWLHGSISGITLGFGSVLMGVAVDYAILVYFALRNNAGTPSSILMCTLPPLLLGAATTGIAFLALFASNLPGIRQMAAFSLIGLAIALALSVLVLPTLIMPSEEPGAFRPDRRPRAWLSRKVALAVTLAILIAGVWWGRQVQFDADIRSLSLVPQALLDDEARFQRTWGGMRAKAMVFASGDTLDKALENNEHVFGLAGKIMGSGGFVSLAPVLPSAATQEANIRRWQAFWSPHRLDRLRQDITTSAGRLGFTPDAFQPLMHSLEATPSLFGIETLRNLGLGELVDLLTAHSSEGAQIITLIPDDPALLTRFQNAADGLPGVRAVSQTIFRKDLGIAVQGDFLRFILLALGGNVLALALALRSLRLVCLAVIPTILGMAAVFGVFGALGISLNLFGVVAIPLLLGIGVDYGVFMVMHGAGERNNATAKAVAISGLTTMAGFGSLVLAAHPALHSIGLTVLTGATVAVAAAIFLLPALEGEP